MIPLLPKVGNEGRCFAEVYTINVWFQSEMIAAFEPLAYGICQHAQIRIKKLSCSVPGGSHRNLMAQQELRQLGFSGNIESPGPRPTESPISTTVPQSKKKMTGYISGLPSNNPAK